MSDEFSEAPIELPQGSAPLNPESTSVVLLALLAVVAATSTALGRSRRQRFVTRLALIADDWERAGAGASLSTAARRFLRPALALLGRDIG